MKKFKENKTFKQKIEELLFELKQVGLSRSYIEKELDYSENYITQLIAKGGNEKFYKRLLKYKNDVLQNATNIEKIQQHLKEQTNEIPIEEKAKTYDKLLSILVAEVAAIKADKTGEPVQSIIMKLYKAAGDERLGNY